MVRTFLIRQALKNFFEVGFWFERFGGQNVPGQNVPGQNVPGQNVPGQNGTRIKIPGPM